MKKVVVFITTVNLLFFCINIVFSHNKPPIAQLLRIQFSRLYIVQDSDNHSPLNATGEISSWFRGRMLWGATATVECNDPTFKSSVMVDTYISRFGQGIVDEDLSPRETNYDYVRWGIFSETYDCDWSEILPVGASNDPRRYIEDCYSYTYVSGSRYGMFDTSDIMYSPSSSEGGVYVTTQLPDN